MLTTKSGLDEANGGPSAWSLARLGRPACGALCSLLAVGMLGCLIAVIGVPLVMRGSVLAVTSGSMRPEVNPGDVVVTRGVKPAQACQRLSVGDLVSYDRPGQGLVTHRVVAVSRGEFLDGTNCRFTTQGDANAQADAPVGPAQVRGKVLFSLPWIGWPWQRIGPVATTLLLFVLTVAAGLGAWCLWGFGTVSTGTDRHPVARGSRPPSRPSPPSSPRPPSPSNSPKLRGARDQLRRLVAAARNQAVPRSTHGRGATMREKSEGGPTFGEPAHRPGPSGDGAWPGSPGQPVSREGSEGREKDPGARTAHLKRWSADLGAYAHALAEREHALAARSEQVEELKRQVAARCDEFAATQQRAHEQAAERAADLEERAQALDRRHSELEAWEAELSSRQSEVESRRDRLVERDREVESTERRLRAWQAELTSAQDTLRAREQQLDHVAGRLRDERDRLARHVEELRRRATVLAERERALREWTAQARQSQAGTPSPSPDAQEHRPLRGEQPRL